MSSPRVLHLINGEYYGGSARVLTNYLESSARRYDVAVGVMFRGELERRCRALGIPTDVISMSSRADIGAARQVFRLARRFGADIVHTHQVRNTLLGRIAASVDAKPVVTHVHSPASRESTRLLRNLLTSAIDRGLARRTARFIPVSESLAEELIRLRVSRTRIRVVPNGITLPRTTSAEDRAATRASLGVAPDEYLVGMVANFRPRKGAETLIAAVGLLASKGLALKLVLVGEPFREPGRDYGRELEQYAAEKGIGARTTLTGFRADTDRLMASFDLFVLPSLFGEGLPMVLLEAMAVGLPVVTTPTEGIAEVVKDGVNGLLVPPGESEALATAMRSLAENSARAAALGRAAQQTVCDAYTTDRMAAGIERVYKELVTR
jgi:glycosyltransferase involved in cell wall biosynthesis